MHPDSLFIRPGAQVLTPFTVAEALPRISGRLAPDLITKRSACN